MSWLGRSNSYIVGNKIDAASMRLLGSYDAAGGAQIAGHRTTADWLATTTGITSPAAGGGYTPPGRYVMTCLRLLRRWAAGRSVWNMCGPSAVPAGSWARTTPVSRPRWPGSQPSTPPRIYAPSWK